MLDFGVQMHMGMEPTLVSPGDSQGLLQEEEGKDDDDTLELYQQSLGELLLLLAGELGRKGEVKGMSPMPC